jgi:hypothetical protein
VNLKCWYMSDELYDVTSRKSIFFNSDFVFTNVLVPRRITSILYFQMLHETSFYAFMCV